MSKGTPVVVNEQCTFEGSPSTDSKYTNLKGVVEKVGPSNLVSVKFFNKKLGLLWKWNLTKLNNKKKNTSSKTKKRRK